MKLFFFQAEDGIRDAQESRGLGDVYKRQDFATFGVDPEGKAGRGNTRREVMQAQWRLTVDDEGVWYRFDIEANAFLRTMVRTIVATLLAVGRGERTSADVRDLLLAAERRLAPPPAPACGLCLVHVRY